MHNVYNALSTFAVAKELGMKDDEIVNALSKYKTSGLRQNLTTICGQKLFLDCYNASSESIKGALESFDFIKKNNHIKTIAIIGDVLELGEQSEKEHEKIGEYILNSETDIFLLYGKEIRKTYDYIMRADVKAKRNVIYTSDYNELTSLMKENISRESIIMLKGSRDIALERLVDDIFGTWLNEEVETDNHRNKRFAFEKLAVNEFHNHLNITGIDNSDKGCIEIPDYINGKPITGIERSAFSNNNKLIEVQFPKTIRNIRYCSFYKCSNLKQVNLPKSLRLLDRSAFSTCENLEKVFIEDGLKEIRYRAFGNCKKLKEIHIPDSVVKIEEEVFLNCNGLTIYCQEGSVAHKYAVNHNIKFTHEENE